MRIISRNVTNRKRIFIFSIGKFNGYRFLVKNTSPWLFNHEYVRVTSVFNVLDCGSMDEIQLEISGWGFLI